MRISRRHVWIPLSIFVVAFAVRSGIWYFDWKSLEHDIDAYLEIARHLARGDGFSRGSPPYPTAFRPPLFPIVVASLFWLGGPIAWLGGLHVLLGTITTILTFRCGQLLRLGNGSLIAAALVALDPLLIRYTTLSMTETLCSMLVILWCWVILEFPSGSQLAAMPSENPGASLIDAIRHKIGITPQQTSLIELTHVLQLNSGIHSVPDRVPKHWAGFIHGACFGMICLCRPAFLAAAGLIGIYLISSMILYACISRWANSGQSKFTSRFGFIRTGRRLGTREVLFTGLGLALVLSPWVIRNLIVFGKPIAATTHGGYTILLANNPVFYREVLHGPHHAVWEEKSLLQWQASLENELHDAEISPFDEVQRDHWLYQQAIHVIRKDPNSFLEACLYRSSCFWALAPRTAHRLSTAVRWTIMTFYGIVSASMVLGLLRFTPQEWRQWSSLMILPLILWATHLVYWTDTRMRAPVIPILALVAARAFRANPVLSTRETLPTTSERT